MSNICPSCNLFCSLENEEPEVVSFDVSDGSVEAEVRLVRSSSCCGDEIKEYSYQIDESFDHACDPCEKCEPCEEDTDECERFDEAPEYEGDEPEFQADESGGHRYKANVISVSGTAEITCSVCKAEIEVPLNDEAKASYFDEC